MASKYYQIEVSFRHNNRWEALGEKHPLMHKAIEHMNAIDLSFPTRIVKVTKEVVLQEISGERKKHGKSTRRKSKTSA